MPEVLPAIHQTDQYQYRVPETFSDLAGTGSTMTIRDTRRGKKKTSGKTASRIATHAAFIAQQAKVQ